MKDIYTPKEAALEVIMERRNNSELRERVTRYLGERLPAACFLADTPPAFLARYVPRATDEDRLFADEARARRRKKTACQNPSSNFPPDDYPGPGQPAS